MANGFDPTVSGGVLGVHEWEPKTRTIAVRYLGASPPQVTTAISNVFEPTDIAETVPFTNATNESMSNLELPGWM